jgi:hypothetical protein
MRGLRSTTAALKSDENSWDLALARPQEEEQTIKSSSASQIPIVSSLINTTSVGSPKGISPLPEAHISGGLSSEASSYLEFVAELEKLEAVRRQEFLSCIQKTAQLVKRIHEQNHDERKSPPFLPHHFLVLNLVICPDEELEVMSRDRPSYDLNSENPHLSGSLPINDLEIFLERHPGYLFVVFRHHECNCNYGEPPKKFGKSDGLENPDRQTLEPKESIRICSEEICHQLKILVKDLPHSVERFPKFDTHADYEISAPYFFYYHNREFFSKKREKFAAENGLGLLLDYISQSVAEIYKEVDDLLSQNVLTAETIPYLFSPTTTIVTPNKDGLYAFNQYGKCEVSFDGDIYNQTFILPVETWSYNGTFTKISTKLVVVFHVHELDSYSKLPKKKATMKIQELSAYPIRYAPEQIKMELLERGKKFWRCRKQNYVLYTGLDYARTQHFVSK